MMINITNTSIASSLPALSHSNYFNPYTSKSDFSNKFSCYTFFNLKSFPRLCVLSSAQVCNFVDQNMFLWELSPQNSSE